MPNAAGWGAAGIRTSFLLRQVGGPPTARRGGVGPSQPAPATRKLETLTVNEVGKLLEGIELGLYASAFKAEQISGSDLVAATEEDLEEIGVIRLHRRRIVEKAAEFAQTGVPIALIGQGSR